MLVLVIEQDSEIISVLIALLAEIKQASLHFFPSCEAASKALKKMKRVDIVLYSDTGLSKDTKKFIRLLHRYPEAHSVVTLAQSDVEEEEFYRKAGVIEFLYKNESYIGSIRRSIRRTLLRHLLPAVKAQLNEEDYNDFLDKMCRLNRGDLLSHYRISGEIVLGLTGKIYRAEDAQNGHVVSIQIIAPGYGEESSEKLLQEAKNLIGFHHPGIARIFEVVQDDDLPFIAAEFIEGETLLSVI